MHPPSVVIECGPDNTCLGYTIPPEMDPAPELSQDHCGIDQPPLMMMSPGVSFGCGN
ncbi:MAG TPA: hypothetical protein VK459_26670 [Polyangiaceae bacterium]|nr:hypothetical protein [Polyangiaceae bacterium]